MESSAKRPKAVTLAIILFACVLVSRTLRQLLFIDFSDNAFQSVAYQAGQASAPILFYVLQALMLWGVALGKSGARTILVLSVLIPLAYFSYFDGDRFFQNLQTPSVPSLEIVVQIVAVLILMWPRAFFRQYEQRLDE
ncbi:MAG: hypothetical protein AAF351_00310 [Pseudomonadota bacterium]